MSEPLPAYYADLIPTAAELKLLARLRQLGQARTLAIVDPDSMTLWAARGPEHCNGKHPRTVEEMIIEARNA
jgi:hypothetical protein